MLTATQLAGKRHARTMSSRQKAKDRAHKFGEASKARAERVNRTQAWLERLGIEQKESMEAIRERLDRARQQAQEPAKVKPLGPIGRAISFLRHWDRGR